MAAPDLAVKVVAGTGAFGTTYRVVTRDGQEFAQKEVLLSGCSEGQVARLRREVEVLSQLRNVCIIEYIGSYESDGHLCIMMQWADGGDLQNLLRGLRGGRLPDDEVMRLFIQICLAVNYLHEHNFVHRDLKPANILLMKDGVVKLADFGCARQLGSRELATSFVGTCPYMAPELFESERSYDSKVDIWSLGCILYELYTFRAAFAGDAAHIRALHAQHWVPDCDGVAQEARDLIRRMLTFNPADRLSARQILMMPFVRRYLLRFLEAAGLERLPLDAPRRQDAPPAPKPKNRRPEPPGKANPRRPAEAPRKQNADWRPAPRRPDVHEDYRHPPPRKRKQAAAAPHAGLSPPPREADPRAQRNQKPGVGAPNAERPISPCGDYRHPPPHNRKPAAHIQNAAPSPPHASPRQDYRHPPPRRQPADAARPSPHESRRPAAPSNLARRAVSPAPDPRRLVRPRGRAVSPGVGMSRIPRLQPAVEQPRLLPAPVAKQPGPPPVLGGRVVRDVGDYASPSVATKQIPIDVDPGLLHSMRGLSTLDNLFLNVRAAINWGELDPGAQPEEGVAAEEKWMEEDEDEQ
jgi:NIMA (never in mitosis gene a)-related kinase